MPDETIHRFSALLWRSGLDQFGDAITEQALKSMATVYKAKLPQPLTPDFRFNGTPVGTVVDCYWREEDKSVYVDVEQTDAQRKKWPNYPFEDVLRPAITQDTHHPSRNTGYKIITSGRLLNVSCCFLITPAKLPDPYVLYI